MWLDRYKTSGLFRYISGKEQIDLHMRILKCAKDKRMYAL